MKTHGLEYSVIRNYYLIYMVIVPHNEQVIHTCLACLGLPAWQVGRSVGRLVAWSVGRSVILQSHIRVCFKRIASKIFKDFQFHDFSPKSLGIPDPTWMSCWWSDSPCSIGMVIKPRSNGLVKMIGTCMYTENQSMLNHTETKSSVT